MKPIENEFTTHHIGTPQDWDKAAYGECIVLPVAKTEDKFTTIWYSYWTLSWKERIRVLFGRPVRLVVMASYHPPVALDLDH